MPKNAHLTDLLGQAGMRKKELAERLGLSLHTPYRWGDEVPQYAIAYLELYVRVKNALE